MKFQFSGNGDYVSMELSFDSVPEQHMLEAFRTSPLSNIVIEKTSNGLKVSKRSAPVPTEETGNTQ